MNRGLCRTPQQDEQAEREHDLMRDVNLHASRADMLASSLRHLLQRYLEIVDSSAHGGWSQAGEETVRAVVAVLEPAGSHIRPML